MLIVGICDDLKQDVEKIKNLICKAFFSQDEDYKVVVFGSGREVIDSIEKNEFFCNLLMLDIYMKPVDGMEVADYIRKNRVDVDIIFVTKSVEHVYEGYVYKAFAYILKENMDIDMEKELLRYVDELDMSEECLNVTSKNQKRRIPISAIRYIESVARKLVIHTKAEDIGFYAKFSDIDALLSERGFVRTHQSYMVRINEIKSIGREFVTIDKVQIPISRRYYEAVKKIYDDTFKP